jgi:dTDP-4-amino-4,6-dideoxygalactose transaminase
VGAALDATLASGQIAQGENVVRFEQALRARLATERVAAISDCSGALTLALYLAGLRPGDEVIVSPMNCVATTMPIANLYARAVWCDVDPATGMLDPAAIAPLVTERTRAVLACHWSGDVADIAGLHAVALAHRIRLVADASEAFGARWCDAPLGATSAASHADFTVFSFGPVRHLTCGEGAALVSATDEDFERARWLRRYGIHQPSFRLPGGDLNPDSDIPVAGFNFPLNNIAAAIGLAQLADVDRLIARHRENGRYFDQALAGIAGVSLLSRRADSESAYWAYSFRAQRRADLLRKLHEQGIGAQRLHLRNDRYGCFAGAGGGPLPGVEVFDAENVAIPCGWWVSEEDRSRIAAVVRAGW